MKIHSILKPQAEPTPLNSSPLSLGSQYSDSIDSLVNLWEKLNGYRSLFQLNPFSLEDLFGALACPDSIQINLIDHIFVAIIA